MILLTIDNEIDSVIFHILQSVCLCGLVVRIAASHPGGPGNAFLVSFHFLPNFKALFWPSANFGEQKAFSP